MRTRADRRHLRYPYLHDSDEQTAAMSYGASAVPQIFVFDRDRKLRYEGRIDDNIDEARVRSPHARLALDALLADQSVATATTTPAGCLTRLNPATNTAADELAAIEAEPVTVSPASVADLTKLRTNPTRKVLLVNFWATWCGPCTSEFPDLQATYRMYRSRGFAMVTVSENDPAEREGVLAFLQKQHASTTNLLFASSDTAALQEAFDRNTSASVPFSVLLAPNGEVLYQEAGAVALERLRRVILANLPEAKAYPGLHAFWSGE
jgi:thiol-disulfide isomerase/thioredoxin